MLSRTLGLLFVCVAASSPACGQTILTCYSELAGICSAVPDGELSGDNLAPTDLGLFMPGTNSVNPELHVVRGQVQAIGDVFLFGPDPPDNLMFQTADIFTFQIPDGAQLENIFLRHFDSASNLVFVGIDTGNDFDASPYDINLQAGALPILAGSTVGTPQLNAPGGFLSSLGTGPAGSGFVGPLGAGEYTMYVQETNGSSTYEFGFQVVSISAVPEPSMFAALGLVSCGLGLRRWRRRRPPTESSPS